jgi:hypothetical protein
VSRGTASPSSSAGDLPPPALDDGDAVPLDTPADPDTGGVESDAGSLDPDADGVDPGPNPHGGST